MASPFLGLGFQIAGYQETYSMEDQPICLQDCKAVRLLGFEPASPKQHSHSNKKNSRP